MSIKLESNTHFSKAKFLQEGVHEWQSRAGQTEATMICTALDALVESNLAVAYEARNANMIAAYALLPTTDDEPETFLGERVDAYELARQITERLDLA